MMRATKIRRGSLAELRRIDRDQKAADAAGAASLQRQNPTANIYRFWLGEGISPRAAGILTALDIADHAELRAHRSWHKARGCGPVTFLEIIAMMDARHVAGMAKAR